MKKHTIFLFLTIVLSLNLKAQSIYDQSTIKELMDRTNEYQLKNPWKAFDDNWIRGTYYTGVMASYLATGDDTYLAQSNQLCEDLNWTLPTLPPDHEASGVNLLTIGQTMLQSYMVEPEKSKIRGIVQHLENPGIKNPVANPDEWYFEGGRRYVDGLFTGPPALAMLYSVTGDEKYLQWMESCFWDVYGKLYDTDEHLFYRDKRFFPENIDARKNDPKWKGNEQVTANGKKVIWSRGNGWAIAGIARILEYLPMEHASYNRYELLLKDMAYALKDKQTQEGFWYPNLADPEYAPFKETSGTSFFIYGLAYGINNGILDKDEFVPVVKKAWKSVTDEVSKDGKVQWGQLVGDRPVNLSKDDSHEYVTGTFLLAASEMYKMNLNDN
ncbi:glycoside hydrolase family 88 protein [Zobellia galactanivorans]|uniref:glycoside hydrolase family 88 protein n=1 Tax=Zobellia galactanivorans (strain DSM 12802 / CCUG 47099 / CIP 106680 / NCIMB 13871 / Dsij) TaxID=63186 RepID=UPI001C068A02|nr:glycoside hydrolase family 88 protein [Zobellia galactanivorans]MBU3028409.1 glycoside hydrolase family 88 protein [Zobellia galactanivorans]